MLVKAEVYVEVPDDYLHSKGVKAFEGQPNPCAEEIDSFVENEAQWTAMHQLSWILHRGVATRGNSEDSPKNPIKLLSLVMPDSPEPEITGTIEFE